MKQTLGNAIKNRRKKLGLSVVGLAERLGMNRSYIHKIENQSFIPSIKIIGKIASALELSTLIDLYLLTKENALRDEIAKQRKSLTKIKTSKRLKK